MIVQLQAQNQTPSPDKKESIPNFGQHYPKKQTVYYSIAEHIMNYIVSYLPPSMFDDY